MKKVHQVSYKDHILNCISFINCTNDSTFPTMIVLQRNKRAKKDLFLTYIHLIYICKYLQNLSLIKELLNFNTLFYLYSTF